MSPSQYTPVRVTQQSRTLRAMVITNPNPHDSAQFSTRNNCSRNACPHYEPHCAAHFNGHC